jgi:hypothetical protein
MVALKEPLMFTCFFFHTQNPALYWGVAQFHNVSRPLEAGAPAVHGHHKMPTASAEFQVHGGGIDGNRIPHCAGAGKVYKVYCPTRFPIAFHNELLAATKFGQDCLHFRCFER